MKGLNAASKSPGQKILFLIIGLVVVCGLFIPFTTINLWWREALNSSHVILFFFVSVTLHFLFSARSFFTSAVANHVAVLVVGLLIGVGIEILQGVLQREASVDDLFKNLLGILSGLSFVVLTQQKRLRNKIISGFVSASFLLSGIAPLFQISWGYLQREKTFPIITAFEEEWFSRFVHLSDAEFVGVTKLAIEDGEKFHQIRFDPEKYPGVEVIEPEKNWSTYHTLQFQVYSNNVVDIILVLKIVDDIHNQDYNDRFNQRFIIRPGLNEIIVNLQQIRDAPVSRELDLTNVSGVQLFLLNVESPLFLGLSDLYLEK